MEGSSSYSYSTELSPSQRLLYSAHDADKLSCLKTEECDTQTYHQIQHALHDPIARIPRRFQQGFYQYQYFHQKRGLLLSNHLAQLAFLLYFWADRFVLPDVATLSGIIRVVSIISAFGLTYFLFNKLKNVAFLDLVLPLLTALSAVLWFEILLLSSSPWVSVYQYAALILIMLGNLSIQVHFRPSLFTSSLISAAILWGVYRLNEWQAFIIYLLAYVPVLLFSIYICWNNTITARKTFLRALLNEWNYHVFRDLAHTDELTKLNNRRQFLQQAEKKLQDSTDSKIFSLLIFDVDNFKLINDNYGHDAGDQVLCAIADIACQEMRRSDVLARFGGEEFIALLPDTSQQEALMLAERLRVKMAQHQLYIKQQPIPFSVSIGVAQLDHQAQQSLNDLIKHADIALYEAKRSGRNRVMHYDQLALDLLA